MQSWIEVTNEGFDFWNLNDKNLSFHQTVSGK